MRHQSVKPLATLTKEYNDALARCAFLLPAVRAMNGVLDGIKGKGFDIRNVQAMCDAIKQATGATAYPYKGTGYDGQTFYKVVAEIPGTSSRQYEEFDTKYSYVGTGYTDKFRDVLKRFDGVEAWSMETRDKINALEARHKFATELLEKLNAYSDLIE